ncbi:hypothetical protein [Streptomyces mirabilis]|uniref:hypothetical protein n=1 Tax=Streptomyces mirabilis TaxID=68239 RepID=UPI0033F2CB3D
MIRTEPWRDLPEAAREGLFTSAAQSLPVGRGGVPEDVRRHAPTGIPCPAPRLSPR